MLPVYFHTELVAVVTAQQKTVRTLRASGELSFAGSRIYGDGLVGRIEIGQRRVVPEKAVALARQ